METSLLGWIFRMKILEWGGDRKSRGSNSLQSEPLQLAVGVQRLRTVTTSPALPSPRFLQTPLGVFTAAESLGTAQHLGGDTGESWGLGFKKAGNSSFNSPLGQRALGVGLCGDWAVETCSRFWL